MLSDAPSCPLFTKDAPLPAAPSTASRLTTEVTTKNPVRGQYRPDHQGNRPEQQEQAEPGVHRQRGRTVRQGPADGGERTATLFTSGHGDVQADPQAQRVLDEQPDGDAEARPPDGLAAACPRPPGGGAPRYGDSGGACRLTHHASPLPPADYLAMTSFLTEMITSRKYLGQ